MYMQHNFLITQCFDRVYIQALHKNINRLYWNRVYLNGLNLDRVYRLPYIAGINFDIYSWSWGRGGRRPYALWLLVTCTNQWLWIYCTTNPQVVIRSPQKQVYTIKILICQTVVQLVVYDLLSNKSTTNRSMWSLGLCHTTPLQDSSSS